MKKYFKKFFSHRLFEGITPEAAMKLLTAVGADFAVYQKEQITISEGEKNPNVCVVLSGQLDGIKQGRDGSVVIVSEFREGDVYGEILSGSRKDSPVTVICRKNNTHVLSIPFEPLLLCEREHRAAAARFVENLLAEIADKYFVLMRRVGILSKRTIRAKIAALLCGASSAGGVVTFDFGRERMAELLGCERSALSRELMKMRADGLIYFDKNVFTLIDKARLESEAG